MMYHNRHLGFTPQSVHIPGSVDCVSYEFQALNHTYYTTENNITAKDVFFSKLTS